MKIFEDGNFFQSMNTNEVTQGMFNKLSEGDVFTAEIVNITPEFVALKLSDNTVINAKSLVIPDAVIGQKAEFSVKHNNNGLIQIEFSKSGKAEISVSFVKNILDKMELPFNQVNIEIIKTLIKSDIEINPENVNKALFFSNAGNKMNMEKLSFLLKEEISANKVNVDTLDRIIEEKTNLKSDIIALSKEILKMEDEGLKKELLDIIGINRNIDLEPKKAEKLLKEIREKLFVDVKKMNLKEDFKETLSNVYRLVDSIAKKAKESGETDTELAKTAENIKNAVDFTSYISNYKSFFQLPIVLDNKENQCEFYVFKGKKNKKTGSKSVSALISLEYVMLGKVETFIEKTGNSLNFQFRCQNDNTNKILKANIGKLSNMLSEKGFRIETVLYKKIEESFNVLSEEENDTEKIQKTSNKRFSFDMRV